VKQSNAHSPEDDSDLERAPTPAEQAALQWVVRSERGLGAAEDRELAAWLAADGRHRELFEEFGGTWAMMGDAPAVTTARAAVLERAEEPASRPRRGWAWAWVPLAAAAALAIAYVQPRGGSDLNGEPVATEVGDSRQLKLPDGSLVRLNTNSLLVMEFTAAERRVRLERGEAFFEVAKNPDRPFIVEVAGVGVRAVGTAFNVHLRRDDVDVLVTEGKVRVAAAGATNGDPSGPLPLAEIEANERVIVPLSALASPQSRPQPVAGVPVDEVKRLLAWHGGMLEFSNTPLGEMVAEFNRYNRHQLAIVDLELAGKRFGGSFRPDDREGFVRALSAHHGVRAVESANQTLLYAR
jgi:transmembrane sensor